jgi:hypothetical protein
MRKILAIVATAVFVAAMAAPIVAADMTVKGEVVDVACANGKGESGKGDGHAGCAMSCAKRGQPVGILTADAIYIVSGDYTANNNAKLLDFVAKQVEVTGAVTEKDGKRMLDVKSIKLAKKTNSRSTNDLPWLSPRPGLPAESACLCLSEDPLPMRQSLHLGDNRRPRIRRQHRRGVVARHLGPGAR